MSDLLWDDVEYFFDLDEVGSLPDVRVPDASVEDWQAVLHLIGASGWKCQYSEGEVGMPVPRVAAVLSLKGVKISARVVSWVFPPGE